VPKIFEGASSTKSITFAWLEITPSCQLQCVHCYCSSAPSLGHGTLTIQDWKHVITSLRATGVRSVQFIGGEPTIHPNFCELLEYAAQVGLHIEVYTNLVSISAHMWEIFTRHQVHIATSWYTDSAVIHDSITGVVGSYYKTLVNMKKALELGLSLRIGMVHMREDQDIAGAKTLLVDLGVKKIGVDRARGVGRGIQIHNEDPVSALCGKCTDNKCVVTASGEVYHCIMSRSFCVGSVLQDDIATILAGSTMQTTTTMLRAAFAARTGSDDCDPDELDCDPECDPQTFPDCDPDCCPATVADCEPSEDDDEEAWSETPEPGISPLSISE
jgi:sulfatase maturation enzyme AslB (radical SAM superfamily)